MKGLFLVTVLEVFFIYHYTVTINLIITSPNQVLGLSKEKSILGKIPWKPRE